MNPSYMYWFGDTTTNFQGRNGIGKCRGYELLQSAAGDTVMLSPLTSKGKPANAWIEIPLDSVAELIRQLEPFAKDYIYSSWHISDVHMVRRDLTDEQCRAVLQMVDRRHDAEYGINWDNIRFWADELFPNPDYNFEDYPEDE